MGKAVSAGSPEGLRVGTPLEMKLKFVHLEEEVQILAALFLALGNLAASPTGFPEGRLKSVFTWTELPKPDKYNLRMPLMCWAF